MKVDRQEFDRAKSDLPEPSRTSRLNASIVLMRLSPYSRYGYELATLNRAVSTLYLYSTECRP